jgi:hypothetical protein
MPCYAIDMVGVQVGADIDEDADAAAPWLSPSG